MNAINSSDWVVILAGAGAIAWVNWYFFLAGRAPATVPAVPASPAANGRAGDASTAAEITVVVDGGYTPSVIRTRAGQPIRLLFDRRDTSSCSDEVVFPDFGIRQYLPTGRTTAVNITPPSAGRYDFMCGMSMLRGTLIVDD
jgi:plastocyanin domain-containing protein